MSFFDKPPSKPPSGGGSVSVPLVGGRGDRGMSFRRSLPHGRVRASGKSPSSSPVPGEPDGELFRVPGGFFDLRGYWCQKVSGEWRMTRGAPTKLLKTLSKEQRRLLRNAQLKARRAGAR